MSENTASLAPVQHTYYQQQMEDMKKLIPLLKEEMRTCPSSNIQFSLSETIDFYSLKRSFKIKTTSPSDNNSVTFNKFKDTLLKNISFFDTFVNIPANTKFDVITSSGRGGSFVSPRVYDINGDESYINSNTDTLLFIYDNESDLDNFLKKGNPVNIICLSVNMNFFQHKKWLKSHGYLNQHSYYFIDISSKEKEDAAKVASCNLKLYKFPRAVLLNSQNQIIDDVSIKNMNEFDLQKDLYNRVSYAVSTEEEKILNDKFILLENNEKRDVVKKINVYLKKELSMNEVHFFVKSRIVIDRTGVVKTKVTPAFYGETFKSGIQTIDNLIETLHGQGLFHNIQNRVNA